MNYSFQEHLTIEKKQEQIFFSKKISRTFQERSHPALLQHRNLDTHS